MEVVILKSRLKLSSFELTKVTEGLTAQTSGTGHHRAYKCMANFVYILGENIIMKEDDVFMVVGYL